MEGRDCKINIGRISLAYKEWGNSQGIPVVQLHGWLDNANSFDVLNPLLDLERFRVIALDFPGHGLSDHRSESENYHLTEYVLDCEQFCRVMGLNEIYLLGHSLGGVVSTLWAAAIPNRVKRLFLIDALGPITSDEAKVAQQLGSSIDKILSTPGTQPVYETIDQGIAVRQKVNHDLSGESIRRLIDRGMVACDGGYTWRSDRRLRHPSLMRLTEAQALSFLGAIRCPVRAVFAEKGLLLSSRHFSARAKAIVDFQFDALPGGHHLHMQECPGEVAKQINNFF